MDCRSIPVSEIRRLEQVARLCLRRWWDHPDFEELLGEVRLRFWKEVATTERGEWAWQQRRFCLRRHCRETADWFEGAPLNGWRRTNRQGKEVPQRGSLADLPGEWEGHAFTSHSDNWMRWIVPDFVPALLDHLEEERVWEETFSLMNDDEAALIRRWLSGETFGKTNQTIYTRMQRCLNRCRQRVGAPLKFNGQMGRRNWKETSL